MTAPVTLGAVLTGGGSRRMGRDKALVEFDGIPMGRRVADALADGGCAPVVLIGGRATALAAIGRPVVADRFPGEGPLGGVLTALEHATAGSPRGGVPPVLVAACDLPALSADVVRALLDRVRSTDDVGTRGDARIDVCVAHGDRLEPALAVWLPSCHEPVRALFDSGERALHGVLRRLRVTAVDVDTGALRNVNTLGDLGR